MRLLPGKDAPLFHQPSEKTRMPDEPPRKKDNARKTGPRPVTSIEDKPAAALRTMRLHLELGEVEAALAVYKKSHGRLSGWQPQESDWIDLIQALTDQDCWGEAAHVMLDYVQAVPEPSPRVQLKLAQVLIQKLAAHAGAVRAASDSAGGIIGEARSDPQSACRAGPAHARGRRARAARRIVVTDRDRCAKLLRVCFPAARMPLFHQRPSS